MSGGRRQVVIVGAGVVGSSAALALSRALPPSEWQVVLVPTDRDALDLGYPSAIEPSLPSIRVFHAELGIDEDELIRRGIATFSLGTAYTGWTEDGGTAFAPFGSVGALLAGVPFHQLAARLRAAGERIRLTDFSIAALMAQAGRFGRPVDDLRSPLSTLAYGLHLDCAAYAAHLGALAERAGAKRATASFRNCTPSGERLHAITLSDGSEVSGDLFIDASGASALLLGQLATADFLSWRDLFGVDRALAWDREDPNPPAPYAHVEAFAAGWRRSVPGPRGVGELLVYSSAHLSDLDVKGLGTDSHAVELDCGRQSHPWIGNVVAIGGAAGLVEPSVPAALHLARNQIGRLLRLFPATATMQVEAAEFNRETAAELDRTRDFALLRNLLNGRRQDPHWRSAAERPAPAELAAKLALYRSRGRVPLLDGDDFSEEDWAVALESLNLFAERHGALAEAIPSEQARALLARMREAMLRAIAPLPRHADALASIAAAKVAA